MSSVILWLVALAAPAWADEDHVARTFPAATAREIRVRTTIGKVSVEAWVRDEIAVEVVRRVPGPSDRDRLPVVLDVVDGVLRVEAVQTDEGRDAALTSDVVLRVPPATPLGLVEVFEGGVSLAGLTGAMHAVVERGSIEGRALAGTIRLETSSGVIHLDGVSLRPGGLLRCRTFNGDISVKLAERPADARVLVLTLNGRIDSSLPLSERAGFGPRFREGVLGRGDTLLSLDAVRGNISLMAPE
jgi:hypothetical protein